MKQKRKVMILVENLHCVPKIHNKRYYCPKRNMPTKTRIWWVKTLQISNAFVNPKKRKRMPFWPIPRQRPCWSP